ncbi:MAG: hypothetical protein U5K77_00975 [Candidatus Saccharibacteria bacterium]|nr:hypothetical protein [Candidatus Saccharibacteria bacterium]
MTSSDGETWTSVQDTSLNTLYWLTITHGNNTFVAIASGDAIGGTPAHVATSVDGITWETVTADASTWLGVVYGNGRFVAISDSDFGDNRNHAMVSQVAPGNALKVAGDSEFIGNMTLTGDMGIGTDNPQAKLHVAGDVLFQSENRQRHRLPNSKRRRG